MRLLLIACILLLKACDSSSPPQTSRSATNSTVSERSKPKYDKLYSNLGAKNDWPGQQAEVLAEDLNQTNYYLILDGSGSMEAVDCSGNMTKLDVAKQAMQGFVRAIPQDANLGLLIFDQAGGYERVKLGKNNRDKLIGEVTDARPRGGTPLKSALTAGYQSLREQASKQLGYGEYHLVIVTDGEANVGEEPQEIVKTILEESPVVLHTIGFCISGNHSLNQPELINYTSANDPQSLSAGLKSVLAELETFDSGSFEKVQ